MREGYRLIEDAPAVEDYLALRELSGLSPKTREQAAAGLPGSWAACHVVHHPTGQTVGMGRVLSDGGWYQGGLLLAQVRGELSPLRDALDVALRGCGV